VVKQTTDSPGREKPNPLILHSWTRTPRITHTHSPTATGTDADPGPGSPRSWRSLVPVLIPQRPADPLLQVLHLGLREAEVPLIAVFPMRAPRGGPMGVALDARVLRLEQASGWSIGRSPSQASSMCSACVVRCVAAGESSPRPRDCAIAPQLHSRDQSVERPGLVRHDGSSLGSRISPHRASMRAARACKSSTTVLVGRRRCARIRRCWS
jgi:hypothetical protein